MVCTNKAGLYKYDGISVSHFTVQGGLSSNNISKIVEDKTGNIWISSWDSGLNKYDGESFTHFGVKQGLSDEIVHTVLEDKSGNIWLGTDGGGVCKYDGKLFNHIQALRGLNKGNIACVRTDKNGNIWIGTWGDGVYKYDGSSLANFTSRQGLCNDHLIDIMEDRSGQIWFCTDEGVSKFDGKYFTNYSTAQGLINKKADCEMEDSKGNIWFGTEGGVSKFDGRNFINYSIPQGLSGKVINSLFEDHNGSIWFGTADNGLCKFDGITFTHYSVVHGLSDATVNCIHEDKNNNIWVATNQGINKFDGKSFTWYTTEQGLSNNSVLSILEDGKGNLWVGTLNGLNRLNLYASSSGTMRNQDIPLFKKYTQPDGFLGTAIYWNSLAQDNNANIWIGATDRVTNYHPKGDIPDTIPPVIQLSRIALFDENINWRDLEKKKDSTFILKNGTRLKNFNFSDLTPWYNQPQNLQLAYNNNYITFEFIGITTNRPKEVRYKYFLQGLDKNWSTLTDQPKAIYNNLPPGRYTFKLKAVNSEGYWSKELDYPLTILPPWWRTWWAYTAYAAAFAVMIYMLTWYRSRRLEAENILLEEKVNRRTKELEQSLEDKYQLSKKIESQQALLNERLRISRELHDDIGATLSGIVLYSHLAENQVQTQQPHEVERSLNAIQQSANDMVNRLSDIVWSVNPEHNTLKNLLQKLEEYAADMARAKNIKVHVNAPGQSSELQLPVETLHNTYFLCKEAVNNAIKYSNASILEFSMHQFDHAIEITIKDNGIGFDIATVKKGNGLMNMQKRADEIGAKLCLESVPQQGTVVSLQCKIT